MGQRAMNSWVRYGRPFDNCDHIDKFFMEKDGSRYHSDDGSIDYNLSCRNIYGSSEGNFLFEIVNAIKELGFANLVEVDFLGEVISCNSYGRGRQLSDDEFVDIIHKIYSRLSGLEEEK